ncbi:hypothetical protein [Roseovarius sp. EL26]|uniref:hypothetical protein n=1 Tax=Roseovarius sp. EL26 TaxID=2126672 RepID=UPI0013C42E30|nr:hypothetical protein [Roseovarius sp. EL26]
MNTATSPSLDEKIFRVVLVLVIGIRVLMAILASQSMMELLVTGDNDDIMRFLSIQDWMNGQGWFDMRQYRMQPPEGLDLHWSRYVDLGIATLIWPLSMVLPFEQAQVIGIVLWPAILFVLLVIVIGFSARKMFGPLVGATSMMAIILWPVTGIVYFSGARLDHHNVQILLMTVLTLTAVLPGPAIRRGIIGGAAAALSLAVGLEALLVIALFGGILVARALLLYTQSVPQFVAFCVTTAIGSVVLFYGQAPMAEWALNHCDELSVPYLSIAATGAGISVVYAVVSSRLSHLVTRTLVFLALCALGVFFLYPLIEPCFAGPYGNLPPDVTHIISNRIEEARSIFVAFSQGEVIVYGLVLPTIAITFLMTAIWVRRIIIQHEDTATTARLGILLLFSWLGVLASMSQIRLTLLAASAIPILIGFALAEFLTARREGRNRYVLVLLLPLLVVVFAPYAGSLQPDKNENVSNTSSEQGASQSTAVKTCRNLDLIKELADLPRGKIFSSANMSAPILLLTPHSVVTGLYHRSPSAIRDGLLPFEQDETALREAIIRTDVDYLMLCRNLVYGDSGSFGSQLAAGHEVAWLHRIEGLSDELLLFSIVRN